MPSMAASTAEAFIFMKSTSVLSRSKTTARITRVGSLGRDADGAAEADLAIVDTNVEAARRIAAHPRLVVDRGAVAPVVRQRQQHAVVALPALGKTRDHPN